MATMQDVALRAGVSPKTVSRVLNDHDSVTARTRERVRAAMKALDYHPNAVARHLRRNGFQEAYAATGKPHPPAELMVAGDFSFKAGIEAASALLDLDSPPTAIFAANDDMAAATCMETQKRGLRIPDDLSVVGFDDAPIAAVIWPSLTTIRQPFLDMAQRAINTLSAWNTNEAAERFSAPYPARHSLVIRESTGPVRRASAGRAIHMMPAVKVGATDTIWEVA